MKRVASLDYLRGGMALSVMLFHFEKWTLGHWNPATPLGKLGVYAVSIFFVLSGLTLTLVYEKHFPPPEKFSGLAATWCGEAIRNFFKKRILRIFPLLWLATLATFFLEPEIWNFESILLNISGLFAFAQPAGDIATGAWSIGNELVFYTLFPFLILLGNLRRKEYFLSILLLVFVVGGFYAFRILSPEVPIEKQWAIYVQPFNQFFFFAAGVGLGVFRGRLCRDFAKSRHVLLAMVMAAAFLLWPISGNPSSLITGQNRAALSLLSIVFTGAVFFSELRFSGWPHRVLNWLGEVSYTVYLMHPLVWRVSKALLFKLGVSSFFWVWALALPLAFWVSHLIFNELEMRVKHWFRPPKKPNF